MSSLFIRVAQKATWEPLAEVCFPEGSTTENVTLSMLRSAIRDHPDMAMLPERMFTHWYVKGKVLITPIVGDIEEASLADVGLADGGTVLVEFGAGDDAWASPDDELCGLTACRQSFAAAVVADQRSEARAVSQTAQMLRLLEVLTESSRDRERAAQQQQEASNKAAMEMVMAMVAEQRALMESVMKGIDAINGRLADVGLRIGQGSQDLVACVRETADGAHDAMRRWRAEEDAQRDRERERISQQLAASPEAMAAARKEWMAPATCTACLPIPATVDHPGSSHPVYRFTHTNKPDEGYRVLIDSCEPYFQLDTAKRLSRPFHFPNARVSVGDRCLLVFSHTSPNGTNGGLNIGFVPSDSKGHGASVHRYFRDVNAYILALYGTNVWREGHVVRPLAKIADISSKRKMAILFDLSGDHLREKGDYAGCRPLSTYKEDSSAAQQQQQGGTAVAGSGTVSGDVTPPLAAEGERSTAGGAVMPQQLGGGDATATATAAASVAAPPAPTRAYAVLGYMRVFVSDDGTEEGMMALHDRRILVEDTRHVITISPPSDATAAAAEDGGGSSTTASPPPPPPPTFVPAANMLDKGTVTVHGIHMNADIPKVYLSYIG